MNSRTALMAGLVVLASAALALPAVVTLPYFLQLIILALIWVVLAQGQNLIQGFTGYVSIAQAGFMGIGAYSSTLLSVKLGWPVWLSMAAAPLMTAALAVVAAPQLSLLKMLLAKRTPPVHSQ